MKLNVGCGHDIKDGYVNLDVVRPCDVMHDITCFPWPFDDHSLDEILMLDVLEHVSYLHTESVLHESWRILKEDGDLIVQVPDFLHCSTVILNDKELMKSVRPLCNVCGEQIEFGDLKCKRCSTSFFDMQYAAMKRLYGGQDRVGNWHNFSFTKPLLEELLFRSGFGSFSYPETDHMWANWNFKVCAKRLKDAWT